MAYDRVISSLNAARLHGTSFPIVHALVDASLTVGTDVRTPSCCCIPYSLDYQTRSLQITQNFHVLSKITAEPPALPPIEHASAHILNAPLFERKYARAYLGDQESREAIALRQQITSGAREALEEQYWDVLERTVQARPMDAQLGGDPSIANKVRAFLLVRFYRNGEWEDRIEVRYFLGRALSVSVTILLARRRPASLGPTILFDQDRSCSRGIRGSPSFSASHRTSRGCFC
jgi:nuclear pore complex protein Nup93